MSSRDWRTAVGVDGVSAGEVFRGYRAGGRLTPDHLDWRIAYSAFLTEKLRGAGDGPLFPGAHVGQSGGRMSTTSARTGPSGVE